jgi:hypothetical protein
VWITADERCESNNLGANVGTDTYGHSCAHTIATAHPSAHDTNPASGTHDLGDLYTGDYANANTNTSAHDTNPSSDTRAPGAWL